MSDSREQAARHYKVYRHITEVPDAILDQLELRTPREVARFRELQNNFCGVAIFWTEEGWG